MNRLCILGSLAAALLAFPQTSFANEPPVVRLVSATPWVNDETTITYVIHDSDDDVGGNLSYSMFFYPNARLSSVADVQTFATRIVDQLDLDPEIGTGDFAESTGPADVQQYTWDDPGSALQNRAGWAPGSQVISGKYFVYLVADDSTNEPVMAVSDFSVTVTHNATAVGDVSWGQVKTGH